MKKNYFFLLFLFLVVPGCSQAVSPEEKTASAAVTASKELKEKNEYLEKEIATLKSKVGHFEKEKEIFPHISNLSLEFVRAQAAGDKDAMQTLISGNLSLAEKEDGLYIINNDNKSEWLLYAPGKRKYQDMVVQGYEFDEEQQTMTINMREFFVDQNGKPEEFPTFLGLIFKQVDGQWKVSDLYFDV